MITIENSNSIKYYILLTLSVICAVSIDFSGILLLSNHIIYSFIKREFLYNKKYVLFTIISIIAIIILGLLHYFSIFDLFYKYPIILDNPKLYKIILLFITYIPVLFVLLVILKNRKVYDLELPFFVSCIIFAIGGIIFNIICEYDIRNISALLIPTIILIGYFYKIYGYKIAIGVITVIMVLVSAYTNINNKSQLTPSFMGNTKIYESVRLSMLSIISYGDCLFTYKPELSSILSYNTMMYPEACTLEACKGLSGIFVSTEKEENLDKYFDKITEPNIYRLRSIENGEVQFYFYRVSGLKSNRE